MASLTTYTNQRVAFQKDMIFGWCVLAEHGWMPLSQLNKNEIELVLKEMDNSSIFPQDLYETVRQRLAK